MLGLFLYVAEAELREEIVAYPQQSVSDLASSIAEQIGIEKDIQCLSCNEREISLSPDKSLEDLGIVDGSVIIVEVSKKRRKTSEHV